jgi:hypothetical protein
VRGPYKKELSGTRNLGAIAYRLAFPFGIAFSPLLGAAMPLTYDLPKCSFCNRPVDLANAKTDERGTAIHEECAIIQITGKKKLSGLNSFYIVPVPRFQPQIRKKA